MSNSYKFYSDTKDIIKKYVNATEGAIIYGISCRGLWMLTESFGRSTTENHSGRDKQVPAVKDCRFTQTAFGTVVHDSRGKWLGQYETEDAAVEMLREMAKDDGGYSDEI